MQNQELKIFKYSLVIPTLFLIILWSIEIIDYFDNLPLFLLGNHPRHLTGLIGIILSPLIHSDFNHLLSNSLPIVILGTGLIFFYRELAYKVIILVWLLSGLFVWIGAREYYHIGASGLIYGIASFLFFSGIVRKDNRLTAISLLVVFLYGGLVWGVFPVFPKISWEYHLFGAISGFVLALVYRKEGPAVPFVEKNEEFDESIEDGEIQNPPRI